MAKNNNEEMIKNLGGIVNETDNNSQTKTDTNSLANSQVLSIPIKTKNKVDTQAFNVVMNKSLVQRLDKLAKKKGGYSRNELINTICQLFIDHQED